MNKILKILIPFTFVYYEIVFMLLKPMESKRLSLFSILLSFLFGLLIDFILTKVKKHKKVILLVILSIISLIYMIESYVYCMFNTYYFLDTIGNMAQDVAGTYISDIIKLVFDNYMIIILYVLPIIAYACCNSKLFEIQNSKIKKNVNKKNANSNFLIIILLCVFFIATIITFAINIDKLFNEYTFNGMTYNHGLNTGIVMEVLSKFKQNGYTIQDNENIDDGNIDEYNVLDIDFDKISSENKKAELTRINEYVKNEIPTKKNKYTGLFKGKNLIMICAESFYSHAVSEELTPTLYRMMNKGFKFNDYYNALSYISTSTGEYQFLFGLIPILGAQCMRNTVNHNNYFTMANQMKRIGYNTAAFHNGNFYYYNRDITHENLGYDYYMAMGNGLEKITSDNSDFQLFDRTLDLYKDKGPFSVYYMTYDCHMPYHIFFPEYKDNFPLINKYIGEQTMTECKMYYAKLMNFDKALANLIKKLSEAGILDDTVICLTADHYPYGLEQYGKDCLFSICGYEYGDNEIDKRDRNSMILWTPMLEDDSFKLEKEINTPTYSVDILPTLSNLFGLDFDSRFMVGRDVFSEREPLVIWDNYSFKNDKVFYNSITKTVHPINGEVISNEELEKLKNQVHNKISYSKDVNSFDYFKYVFADSQNANIKNESDKVVVNTNQVNGIKKKVKVPVTYKNLFEAIEDMDNIKPVVDMENVSSINQFPTMNFGRYEQDNNEENGKENIEWYIVRKDKNAMMLLSKYILDVKPYNEYGVTDSWGKSSLREFLNGDFYDEAFIDDEKRIIFKMPHIIDNDIYEDNIYIFDKNEYSGIFKVSVINKENKLIATEGTPYAKAKGLYVKEANEMWYDGNSLYWLGNINKENHFSETVEYNGYMSGYGVDQRLNLCGVRPVVCICWEDVS